MFICYLAVLVGLVLSEGNHQLNNDLKSYLEPQGNLRLKRGSHNSESDQTETVDRLRKNNQPQAHEDLRLFREPYGSNQLSHSDKEYEQEMKNSLSAPIPKTGPTKYGEKHAAHNYIFGHMHPNDRLLYNNEIWKKGHMTPVFLDVKFPIYTPEMNGTISYIEILDLVSEGYGGYISIVSGGLGYKTITIHFTGQLGREFHFFVSFYGR